MVIRGASSGTLMTEGGARSASWQTCAIAEIIQQTPSIKSYCPPAAQRAICAYCRSTRRCATDGSRRLRGDAQLFDRLLTERLECH